MDYLTEIRKRSCLKAVLYSRYLLKKGLPGKRKYRRIKNKKRKVLSWKKYTEKFNDKEFFQQMRMSRNTFEALFGIVEPLFRTDHRRSSFNYVVLFHNALFYTMTVLILCFFRLNKDKGTTKRKIESN